MHVFIAVHSGAGSAKERNASHLKHLCATVCTKTLELLESGSSSVDAVCYAVSCLEDNPLTNAGLGSNLTRDGEVECDASVMDARTGHFAGCGAVSGVRNPVQLAAAIRRNQVTQADNPLGLLPPILLMGAGAHKFAVSSGVSVVDPKSLITVERQQKLAKYLPLLKKDGKLNSESGLSQGTSTSFFETDEEVDLDTVGAIAVDGEGNVSAAASSGGILLKFPGRVGQAALMGAGIWCEESNDEAAACCTSGSGEHLIRTDLARQLCKSVLTDKSSFMSETVVDKFLKQGGTSYGGKFVGALVLQTSNWKASGKGFLHVIHNTPTFCWATAGTRSRTPRAEISVNRLPATSTGQPNMVTLGFSV